MHGDAVASAAMPSASPNGGSVGGPSGSPVIAAKPLIASANEPNPGRRAYGPIWPNPVTRAMTSRGLPGEQASGASPQRSSVPGTEVLDEHVGAGGELDEQVGALGGATGRA